MLVADYYENMLTLSDCQLACLNFYLDDITNLLPTLRIKPQFVILPNQWQKMTNIVDCSEHDF